MDPQHWDSGLLVGLLGFLFQVVGDHDLYDDRASVRLSDHQVGAGSRNDTLFSFNAGARDRDVPGDRPAARPARAPQAILSLLVHGVAESSDDHSCGGIVQRLVGVGAPFKGRFVGKMPPPFRTLPRHHGHRTSEAFVRAPFEGFSALHRIPGFTASKGIEDVRLCRHKLRRRRILTALAGCSRFRRSANVLWTRAWLPMGCLQPLPIGKSW